MELKDYKELRIKRNKLRDISQGWSFFQYNKAKKQIKKWDILLSQFESLDT